MAVAFCPLVKNGELPKGMCIPPICGYDKTRVFCPHCMTALDVDGGICPVCGGDVSAVNTPHQLPVGTVLCAAEFHGYLIGMAKGSGGFGITYIGRDLASQRLVAIKEYYPNRCQLQRNQLDGIVYLLSQQRDIYLSGMKSFLREAETLKAAQHIPSVVKVFDYFELNGTAYMVMEYLKGQTLRDLVEGQGTISFAELIRMMRPLLDDVQAMHQTGLIHRDIAPDNIILLPDGTFRLIDFGCARAVEDGKSVTVQYKPGFAPLEQYTSHGQGPYTDVYALCATIYYCITGVVPTTAPDRLGNIPLATPTSLGAVISPREEQVLLWGMGLQPTQRPQSMRALLEQLVIPAPIPWWKRIQRFLKEKKLFFGVLGGVLLSILIQMLQDR